MNDDHIDFGPLDPLRDSERVARALRKIARRAAPLLAARRTPRTAFQQVARWRRPMLARRASRTASWCPRTREVFFPPPLIDPPRRSSCFFL